MTSYRDLAKQYFDQQGFPNVEIEEYGGKIEGLWRMIPENFGVVDISESGTTRGENELTWLTNILTAELVLYENPEKLAEDLEFSEQISELKKLLDTLRTNQ